MAGQPEARQPHAALCLASCVSSTHIEEYFLYILASRECNKKYSCKRKVWGGDVLDPH